MAERVYDFYVGRQSSGKTFTLKRRANYLAYRTRATSVFVLDTQYEWSDVWPDALSVESWGDYLAEMHEREFYPPVVVFQLGIEPDAYREVFLEAIAVGDVVLVIDEAYTFAPAGSTWRGDSDLRRIVYAGRHLRNADGELSTVGIIAATQRPRSVHLDLWTQANNIVTTRVEGDNVRKWIAENFGSEHLAPVADLPQYRWHVLRGSMPRHT